MTFGISKPRAVLVTLGFSPTRCAMPATVPSPSAVSTDFAESGAPLPPPTNEETSLPSPAERKRSRKPATPPLFADISASNSRISGWAADPIPNFPSSSCVRLSNAVMATVMGVSLAEASLEFRKLPSLPKRSHRPNVRQERRFLNRARTARIWRRVAETFRRSCDRFDSVAQRWMPRRASFNRIAMRRCSASGRASTRPRPEHESAALPERKETGRAP